jgi:hypothetical protein
MRRHRLLLLPAIALAAGCSSSGFDDGGGGTTSRPEIAVERSGVSITSNQAAGSIPALTINGAVGSPATAAFLVRNTGSATLAVRAIRIPSWSNLDARSATLPVAAIAPGGSATLAVSVTPDDLLPWLLRIAIDNSDADEDPFLINLGGTAILSAAGG